MGDMLNLEFSNRALQLATRVVRNPQSHPQPSLTEEQL